MTSEMLQVIAEDGAPSHTEAPELSRDQLRTIYRTMLATRELDERGLKLQRQGRIGFYLSSKGQEAAHIGSAFALNPEDWVFQSYRDPGILLLRGITFEEMLHQCYGNAKDNTRGRQMPVHYSFKKVNCNSISSPIGTQIVQAVGAAMAAKIRKDPIVAMTYFGDGGTSSNDFHTGMNFAGVYASPCVFVCENNGWAISCPVDGQTASTTMAAKAEAYGMPGVRVDGNDVLAVYRAAKEAVDRARAGKGPTLLELVTFRMGAHSSSDDDSRYRSEEMMELWGRKDPLARFRQFLVRGGFWEEGEDEELRQSVQSELQAAIEAAEKEGPPPLSSMFDDVFEERTATLEEQWDALRQAYEQGSVSGANVGEFPL